MIAATAPLVLGVGVPIVGFAAWTARDYARRRARLALRLALIRPTTRRHDADEIGPLRRLGRVLAATPVVGSTEVEKLRQNLYAAGLVGDAALERFIGVKIGLAALLLLLAAAGPGMLGSPLTGTAALLLPLGALVAGLRGPDLVLASRAKARREAMDRGLPDALDLLVVCAEAGIGLELALERVSNELRQVHPVLARELAVTVSEMRLLPDRLQALHNMADRVRLDSVQAIASTLSQTFKYGTPLGKALRTLAADFRLIRTTRMEERAARLPVLITVPMIVFILPATTLVVAGPAFLQLIEALQGLAK